MAGQAAAGSGISPRQIGYVLGIAKAYTTRVGEGPFPTEQKNDIGERIGARGAEFGTVTGRKRRCGWFDAVLVRQTVVTGGIDGIALTKLDVLDGLDEIKVCRIDDEGIVMQPPSSCLLAIAGAKIITLDGELADRFARADGFANWNEMREWFKAEHGLPFDGVVLYWQNND